MIRKEEFHFPSSNKEFLIHAQKWIPEQAEYKGILQIHHGMTEYIDRYDEFATFLAENGYLVVGHDHAGHGKSVRTDADYGYFGYGNTKYPSDVLVNDIHSLRTMIQKQYQGLPYYMLGHSMGSFMLRKYITIHADEALTGVVIVGTGDEKAAGAALVLTKLLKKWKGEMYRSPFIKQLTYTKAYQEFDLTNQDVGNNWLSKNEENVKEYWLRKECMFTFTLNAYQGLFEAVQYSGKEANVAKTPKQLRLLIISGDRDPVGNMGQGVRNVYERFLKAGMKDVTMKLYKDDRHEILNELDREIVYQDILDWLTK
ncbi:MAG: alpha/beta hydrolase [Lachnospiraceae bacterium]|nr:alpha/beta hydrolase [Lachnospiraceae bacterium]